MRKSDPPLPVKLVCGLLYHDEQWASAGMTRLAQQFGKIDFYSEVIPFTYTDYYFKEMGNPLYRRFVSLEHLIDPSKLAKIKRTTNQLEEEFSQSGEGKRVLNLDPGYLTLTAFILATSKNYAHRIYLGEGIFAQQELLFDRSKIRTLDWTYPDYRTLEYQRILAGIRKTYMSQVRPLLHERKKDL